ncbi:MAG TPA: peptidylprolyl isomerase [candidate division Zixibacteria bacterium]
MKKVTLILLFFSLILSFSCKSSKLEHKGKALVEVNGQKLTEEAINAELFLAFEDSIPRRAKLDYLNRWIENELLYQEAKKRGLDKSPQVKIRIEQAVKDVLVLSLLKDQSIKQIQVSEEEAKKFYEQNRDFFKRDQDEIRASHILFSTQAQAENAFDRIKKGEDFKLLAQELSLDSQTRNSGGDIGYFNLSSMPPVIANVVSELQIGKVSAPFKTEMGFHILKVTDRKPKGSLREFAEIKDKLIAQMSEQKKSEAVTKLLEELKSKAKIEKYDWAKDTLTAEQKTF